MPRPKGLPKTGGRTKGTPNRFTRSVREAFEQAFIALGGVDALTDWARDHPGEFYKLYARLIPTERHVAVTDAAPPTLDDEALQTRIRELLGNDDQAPAYRPH